MPYSLEVREYVDKVFSKLRKKDKKQMEIINKKVMEICESPYKFKPLSMPMQNLRRVHIGSFVLTYSIDEPRKVVIIEDYAHHDDVY